jgi:hypothetical protein
MNWFLFSCLNVKLAEKIRESKREIIEEGRDLLLALGLPKRQVAAELVKGLHGVAKE